MRMFGSQQVASLPPARGFGDQDLGPDVHAKYSLHGWVLQHPLLVLEEVGVSG